MIMNNLIIIGNGFDLAHNMKTSYLDFMRYIIDTHCKDEKREFCSNLFRLPNDIDSFESLMEVFKKSQIPYGRGDSLQVIDNSILVRLIRVLLDDFSLNNWCDIEYRYFSLLKNIGNKPNLFKNAKALNEEFTLLKNYLEDYLLTQEFTGEPIDAYEYLFSFLAQRDSLILNFNYTNTVERLYSKTTELSKILHIHGELKSDLNPIIFGFAADNEDIKLLVDKEDNEYLRNIKRHEYKRTSNEKALADYLSNHKNIRVAILGHSCGISDKLILEQILNHKNIHSVRIVYYNNYESYFNSQINVYRIINNNDNFEKIVNFQDCCRMPQWDDEKSDYEYMKDFLAKMNKEYNSELKRSPIGRTIPMN